MKFLTKEQYQQYERDGFLVIDGFLDQAEVAHVKSNIKTVTDARADMTEDAEGFGLEKVADDHMNSTSLAKKAGLFRKIQGAVFHVDAVRDVFTADKILDCMEDLMGAPIYYHSSKVMFKPANGGAPKPWHQDAAYWKAFEPKQITVWLAIDDAERENGCIWAVPGSHKLGLIPHVAKELQVEESRIDLNKAIAVPVKAGGLLIFHSLVLHKSERNESDRNRCAIICDYDCLPNKAVDARIESSKAYLDSNGCWLLRDKEQSLSS